MPGGIANENRRQRPRGPGVAVRKVVRFLKRMLPLPFDVMKWLGRVLNDFPAKLEGVPAAQTETCSNICKLPSGPVCFGQFPPRRKFVEEKGLIRMNGKPKNRGSVTPY